MPNYMPHMVAIMCDRRQARRDRAREFCETCAGAVLGVSAALLLVACGCVLAQWVMGL